MGYLVNSGRAPQNRDDKTTKSSEISEAVKPGVKRKLSVAEVSEESLKPKDEVLPTETTEMSKPDTIDINVKQVEISDPEEIKVDEEHLDMESETMSAQDSEEEKEKSKNTSSAQDPEQEQDIKEDNDSKKKNVEISEKNEENK